MGSRDIALLDPETGIEAGYRDKLSTLVVEPLKVWIANFHHPLPVTKVKEMIRCEHELYEMGVWHEGEERFFLVGCQNCDIIYKGTF